MTNTFKMLAEFLDRFDAEVEGRELAEPPQEFQAKLRALAAGALPRTEQAELFAELNRNPEWIPWLATQIKALRPRADAKA